MEFQFMKDHKTSKFKIVVQVWVWLFRIFFPKPERKNSDGEILQMKHVGDNFEMFVTIFDILVTNIFGIGFTKAEIFLNFKL